MYPWAVTHAADAELEAVDDPLVSGLAEAHLVGREDGAVHLDVTLVELAPGGFVDGHVHPFEESFFLLSGNVVCSVGDRSYRLGPGGFGFSPVGTAHAWRNTGDEPARWIRTRSPQPRTLGDADGVHPVADHPAPTDGVDITVGDRTRRHVGSFSEEMQPEPGALHLKGFRSPSTTNVSVWMLVDEVIGAVHHTVFSVQFDPTEEDMTLGGQHFHPFEETYYITEGRAIAHLEDQAIEVGPGDLVFAGVNTLHGFTNPGTDPVRWIEMQGPNPPSSDAFFFAGHWSER